MPKNKNNEPAAVSFGGVTLLVETIAGFFPITKTEQHSSSPPRYGVHFLLRSGDSVQGMSGSEEYRNDFTKYLKRRLHTKQFISTTCETGCGSYEPVDDDDGGVECKHNAGPSSCYEYNGYPEFTHLPEEKRTWTWKEGEDVEEG